MYKLYANGSVSRLSLPFPGCQNKARLSQLRPFFTTPCCLNSEGFTLAAHQFQSFLVFLKKKFSVVIYFNTRKHKRPMTSGVLTNNLSGLYPDKSLHFAVSRMSETGLVSTAGSKVQSTGS